MPISIVEMFIECTEGELYMYIYSYVCRVQMLESGHFDWIVINQANVVSFYLIDAYIAFMIMVVIINIIAHSI